MAKDAAVEGVAGDAVAETAAEDVVLVHVLAVPDAAGASHVAVQDAAGASDALAAEWRALAPDAEERFAGA